MRVSGSGKLGLFGTVGNSTGEARTAIKNLGISTSLVQMQTTGTYAGGIAGYLNGPELTVSLCWNEGSLTGTGNYFGGVIGGIGAVNGVVLDGCGNSVGGIIFNSSYDYVGGVLGGLESGTTNVDIRNCYNLGTVTGREHVGGITGNIVETSQTVRSSYQAGRVTGSTSSTGGIAGTGSQENIIGCYYETGTSADTYAVELSSEKMKSWGAAWKLNGGKLIQETKVSWDYDREENHGYPYPALEVQGAGSWNNVMQGVADGLVEGVTEPSGTPYQIDTAEKLAWFAYQVNHAGGISGSDAVLIGDIDMRAGESRYTLKDRLVWTPIGKDDTTPYTGTFMSSDPADVADTHKIYQIQNLYVKTDGPAGLFGTVAGGNISRIGLSNAVVTGENAGGIAGETSGRTIIARCYNRSEDGGKASVTASGNAGGIVGKIGMDASVRDCYNLETVIKGTGTSSYAGGIVGDGMAGVIQNSYNSCGTVGSITSFAAGAVGAVNGKPGNGAGMSRCYSDMGFADSKWVSQLYFTGNTQLIAQTKELNTVTKDGSDLVYTMEERNWYTSLADEATKGYPTLEPPVMITLSEAMDPAPSADGVTAALDENKSISRARLRYAGEETSEEAAAVLAAWNATDYNSYGYTSANGTFGLETGSNAAGSTWTALSPDTMSLENPTQELGDVSQLKLFTAAAYTCPTARKMLVELSSGTTRYEIRFTVKGVTGKTLKVVMPVKVTMENLRPDQTLKNTDSVDLFITNRNDYPVDGSIVSVEARDGDGYAVLKPVSRDFTFAAMDPITQGVKLKIVDQEGGGLFPAEGIYYNPGPPPSWISYRLKNGGTLPYRYRMEYQAFQYFDTKNQYSYDVTYRFGVSGEDDAADGAEVLIKQAGGKTDG